jgi:hypothetical protein
LDVEYERFLREIPGVEIISPPERRLWGAYSFWLADPDGNMIAVAEKERTQMQIDNLIIKHYLKNVMFINGTAYAGKSTMVKMLADKYGLIYCGENYECAPGGIVKPELGGLINPDKYPNLGYFQTMKDWQEFVSRSPEEYDNWIQGCVRELVAFETTYLMSISQSQKVIVDTNIPADVLREIAGYNQVAIMIAPPSMSTEHFFNRDDDKPFFIEQINKLDDPEWGMANFRAILERTNSQERYDEWLNSGFFTLVRKDTVTDTRVETMETLAKHFRLALT